METELAAVATQLATASGDLMTAVPLVAAASIPVGLLIFGVIKLVSVFKRTAR